MFCTKCGNQLNDGEPFCDSCGAQVSAPSTTAAAGGATPALGSGGTAVNHAAAGEKTKWNQFFSEGDSEDRVRKTISGTVIAAILIFYGYHLLQEPHSRTSVESESVTNSEATAGASEDALHRKLRTAAMEVVHGSNGIGGKVDIGGYSIGCDKVLDEQLTDIEYGTIAAGSARLPAMKANYLYTCISSIDGERQRQTVFWVVVGIDEEANMYRCVKVAGRPVVDEIANQCGFRG
jgi:zinc ribbon protein